jgi:hypothetical protein
MPVTDTPSDAQHEAEVARQEDIAAEIVPNEVEAAVEADSSLVTLRSKDVEQYPLTLSVVGALDLVFEDESATVEVPSDVAEQVTYLQNVEVVA